VEVKKSYYRPRQALRVPEGCGSQISRQSAHEGGKVVSLTHRPPLVLRSIPKEAFADSFQKLYERCQQCVVKDGDYFEGK
jgi:hypothetical protein